MVGCVEKRQEFNGGLLIARGCGVGIVIISAVCGEVAGKGHLMLNGIVQDAVVIARGGIRIMSVGVSAIGGEYIEEVEGEDIVMRVVLKPIVNQPVGHGAGIGGMAGVGFIGYQRWGHDEDEEFVLTGGEVAQQVAIHAFDVFHGLIAGIGVLTPERIDFTFGSWGI